MNLITVTVYCLDNCIQNIYLFQDTREEWRNVFYVCAGCNIIGALIFGLLSSGSVQPWATDEQTIEISTKNIDSYKKIDGNWINISSSADKNDY